jgi:cholesterol 7-desaturase
MGRTTLRELAAEGLEAVAARLGGQRAPVPQGEAEQDRLRTYPPAYPAGWYVLVRSSELGGAPVHVRALGEALVVFRTEAGRVAVLDAHCPHLGADLGGGTVRGDCLQCPFHGWTFTAEGRVQNVPYSDRVPASLGTRAWPVEERDGFVWFYFDPTHQGRGKPAPPPYALPHFPALEDGRMVHRGDHDAGSVRMHLMEFVENSADMAHFALLHGDMLLPWSSIRVPGIRIHHKAGWSRDDTDAHVTWFHDDVELEVLGRRIERTRGRARICIAGPGGVVSFHFDIPDAGRILLYQTHTPTAPLRQRVRFRWFAEPRVPRLLVWYVVGNWIAQWREDVAIWEHKIYRPRPMLVPGDGPILAMRRWYQRFYPEGGS